MASLPRPPLLLLFLPLLTTARMNVLFIGSDDLRPNLGAYKGVMEGVFNSATMYTPNLDKVTIDNR